jgi:creatinine amidohydrolase/Fe(II)-dependent formamide hydrolase-like protein
LAEVMPRLLEAGLRPVTPTGTLGDASRADGRRGGRYLAEQIESYRHRLTRPREAQQGLPSDAAPCA